MTTPPITTDLKKILKPLKWERRDDDYSTRHEALTCFGVYRVEKTKQPDRFNAGWHWKYCFVDYYDEDSGPVNSLKEGKAKIEKDYIDRMERIISQAFKKGALKP